MKIAKKGIVFKGKLVEGYNIYPPKPKRSEVVRSGIAALAMIFFSLYFLLNPLPFETTRPSVYLWGILTIGTILLVFVLFERVFQLIPGEVLKVGLSVWGAPVWLSRAPLVGDLLPLVYENDDGVFLVSLSRPVGKELMEVGPFNSEEEANQFVGLLLPRDFAPGEAEKAAREDMRWFIDVHVYDNLHPGIRRFGVFAFSILALTPVFVEPDLSNLRISFVLMVLLIACISYISPKSGLVRKTNEGNVRYWIRERFFWRREYEELIGSLDGPRFVGRRIHLGGFGWVMVALLNISIATGLYQNKKKRSEALKIPFEEVEPMTEEERENFRRGAELLHEAARKREEREKEKED